MPITANKVSFPKLGCSCSLSLRFNQHPPIKANNIRELILIGTHHRPGQAHLYSLRDTHKAADTKDRHPNTFTNNEREIIHSEEVYPSINKLYFYSGSGLRGNNVGAAWWKRKVVIRHRFWLIKSEAVCFLPLGSCSHLSNSSTIK